MKNIATTEQHIHERLNAKDHPTTGGKQPRRQPSSQMAVEAGELVIKELRKINEDLEAAIQTMQIELDDLDGALS